MPPPADHTPLPERTERCQAQGWSPLELSARWASLILFFVIAFSATGLITATSEHRYAAYAVRGTGDRWVIFDRRPTDEQISGVSEDTGAYTLVQEAVLRERRDHLGWSLAELGRRRRSLRHPSPDQFDISLGVKSSIALDLPGILSPEQAETFRRDLGMPPELTSMLQPAPEEIERLRAALLDHLAPEHGRLVSRLRVGAVVADSRPSWLQMLLAAISLVATPLLLAKLARTVNPRWA